MIKLIFNPIDQTGAASKRFAAMLLFLALLVTLTLADSSPAVAQGPGNTVFLPLIIKTGTNNTPPALGRVGSPHVSFQRLEIHRQHVGM